MSGTMDAGDSYSDDTGRKTQGNITYLLAVSCALIFLLLIISYVSFMCKRSTSSQSPPDDDGDHRLVIVSQGINDDVLMTFPVFIYSGQDTIPHKGDTTTDVNASGCSICLADYKPTNMIRLLPKCSHSFHSKCIDTWLKAHATCPMCRSSSLAVGQLEGKVPLSIQRS